MALASRRVVAIGVLLGVFGAALFFGDSLITPAISVLSAVEGIDVVSPGVQNAVLPIGAAILAVLFRLLARGMSNREIAGCGGGLRKRHRPARARAIA
jgi:KUP system potassium uptake protein